MNLRSGPLMTIGIQVSIEAETGASAVKVLSILTHSGSAMVINAFLPTSQLSFQIPSLSPHLEGTLE